eukprot:TRINITY_DN57536_c0_g1_i1.p1 TRINITY_DN57536_c0_g1~~TRINITY_DN57536_c0_g1_i1.p1  ORF type:complete len:248 (+),score=35.41 TRINITY_DN57536_c0_g1_i1:66-809(+)
MSYRRRLSALCNVVGGNASPTANSWKHRQLMPWASTRSCSQRVGRAFSSGGHPFVGYGSMPISSEAETDQTHFQNVIDFWRDAGPSKWFAKDDKFDTRFRERFLAAHYAAARRELDHWMSSADGALALVILLDQFPRNCFRGSAHMFATDSLAVYFAEKAIEAGHDEACDQSMRFFLYLPFEHAESMDAQNRCVTLMEPLGEQLLGFAIEHRDIIERFGRFPHRNAALGREMTRAENEFLEKGGFSG